VGQCYIRGSIGSGLQAQRILIRDDEPTSSIQHCNEFWFSANHLLLEIINDERMKRYGYAALFDWRHEKIVAVVLAP
jgi:hypothetical protein